MNQTFNEWWFALPEGRRQAILDDKWQLAAAAYAAAIASKDAEIARLTAVLVMTRGYVESASRLRYDGTNNHKIAQIHLEALDYALDAREKG